MDSCLPLPLNKKVLDDIVEKAKDWALMHALGMRISNNPSPDVLTYASFVLLPSIFPKKEFFKAKRAQTIFNEVLHKAAHDYKFLKQTLSSIVEVDDFTKSLFQIYETVHNEGVAQPLSLGILRSDYLLHANGSSIEDARVQQVETNTIASSFGAMTSQMFCLHRYILHELGVSNPEQNIPENYALQGISNGIISAWKLYGSSNAVVLFVVEEVTINICDQRMMEFEIRKKNKDVRVMRRTFRQLSEDGTLRGKTLYVNDNEVAVVYYRSGYVPSDYFSERDWKVRLMIESSKAIKCPSIQYHLVGTKKVQQELARPCILERFLSDSSKIEAAREVFTGLYSLEMNEDGDKIVQKAIQNPYNYVLKPQREGGGNNLYGEDVRKTLTQLQHSKERSAYILMDRIISPSVQNYLIKQGKSPELQEMVSELGVFGVIIGSKAEIIQNEEVGHLLRTKSVTINEGGVAAGFAALDTVYLV